MPDESVFRKKQRENCRSCTVWLNCDLIAAVDKRAEQDEVSATEVIEAALTEYLDFTSQCEE